MPVVRRTVDADGERPPVSTPDAGPRDVAVIGRNAEAVLLSDALPHDAEEKSAGVVGRDRRTGGNNSWGRRQWFLRRKNNYRPRNG